MRLTSILTVTAIAMLCSAFFAETVFAPIHPHFRKKIEARVSRDVTVTLTYQTVTLDEKGAKKMKPGQAWHLANAHFETTGDLKIGGHDLEAGKYSLKAQKAEKNRWKLVLDRAARFSSKVTEDALVLETEFVAKSALFEHLSIDVQPVGDKKETTLHLDVRFGTMLARALIELPEN